MTHKQDIAKCIYKNKSTTVKKKPQHKASPTVRRGSGSIYPASVKAKIFLTSTQTKMDNCFIL